ncbi:NfeD family protein [Moraxella marmotae]|uniref:NfeD family protein n=1 Tax=Moraxella marmotae TaxID=3344520 RepID=UPI0035D51E42
MGLQPWHWLMIGLLLGIVELLLPSFAALWFGVAALLTAVLVWLMPMGLTAQVVIWLILSVLACALWFLLVQPRIKTRTKAGLGGATIVGEVGMLVRAIDADGLGVVRFSVPKLGAAEWQCRTADGQPIAVGERVMVSAVMGNELIVAKK